MDEDSNLCLELDINMASIECDVMLSFSIESWYFATFFCKLSTIETLLNKAPIQSGSCGHQDYTHYIDDSDIKVTLSMCGDHDVHGQYFGKRNKLKTFSIFQRAF